MAKGSVNGSWSVSGTSETSYTLSCSGSYSFGAWYLWGVRVTCYIGGSQVATNAGYTTGKYQTTASCSGSRTISRTHSDQSIYCEVKSWGETVDGIGSVGESDSTGGWITVPAKRSFTVSYNANGGSGAPGSQTKWYGENLTLSSSKPTRTGYTFAGWNTSSNGSGTNYGSGATYSGNSGMTLYAKWTANTWGVTYDANGGTGAPEKQVKTYGVDLTLSSTKPTRKDYNFLGWGTSASATTVSYAAGAKYKTNAAVTLYAIWELAWVAPDISNLSISRTDENGVLSEDGTNIKVSFDWTVDKLYDLTSITVRYKKTEDAEYGDPVTVQGASTEKQGTVNAIVGSNSISTEYAYDVYITVSDANGSTVQIRSIGSKYYTMDFKAGGKGIALGKPATKDNKIEFGLPTLFSKNVSIDKNASLSVNMDRSKSIFFNHSDDDSIASEIYVGYDTYTPTSQSTKAARGYPSLRAYNYFHTGVFNPNTGVESIRETINKFGLGFDNNQNAVYSISHPKAFRDALGMGKLLWSGSLSIGGSVTISDLPKYTVFGANFFAQKNAECLYGYRVEGGTTLCLSAIRAFAGEIIWTAAASFTISGSKLTYDAGNSKKFVTSGGVVSHNAYGSMLALYGFA